MPVVAVQDKISSQHTTTSLKVAINIMEKWGCSAIQMQAILAIQRSTFFKYKSDPSSAKLVHDQIERISYILNIHQALRMIFSNSENFYGFVKVPNHNPYFEGKTPLELMATGNFACLYEVYKRIDAMRSGAW